MWLQTASLLTLGHIVFTDFKARYVHLLTVLALLAVTVTRLVWGKEWVLWEFYAFNLLFIGFILVVSIGVVSYKKSIRWREVMGIGDVVFLLLVCFWFDTMTFIIYFNVSVISALIAHFALSKLSIYDTDKGVPFAGYFAIVLMIFTAIR